MDPTLLTTILTGAVSTLFGLLVNEWRLKDKSQKERIEKLEEQLAERDTVIMKNTDTLEDVTKSTASILEILREVVEEDPQQAQSAARRSRHTGRG